MPQLHSLALVAGLAVSILGPCGVASAQEGNVDLPRYPSISPDGSQIVFSWRGDLWKVSSDGGYAMRITAHPADDLASAWSPDGNRIAFESDRHGAQNLFMMNADGTGVRNVTEIDESLSLVDFGTDSEGNEVLLLSAGFEDDVYRAPRPYMISTDGGRIVRVHDAFGSHPHVAEEGNRVLFTRGGSSWSRRHYRGSDDRDVWLFNRSDGTFRQLTEWEGNDGKAKWDSRTSFLFLSDREDDAVNLYRMHRPMGENPRVERLTRFTDRDIWGYDVSHDGSTAVFVVWDTLYTLDLGDENAEPRALTITASEDEADNFELLEVGRRVDEAALSPDGKTMAVVAYGEVYVRAIEEDAPTRRVTHTHARERDIAWSPDGLKLYFVSDEDGTESIYAAAVALTRSEVKEEFNKKMGIETEEEEEEPKEDEEADEEDSDDEQAAPQDDDAAADPVSGTWSGVAAVPEQAEQPFTLTLTLDDDDKVTGTLEAGEFSGDISGSFDRDANKLTMSVSTDIGLVINFELTIDNGTAAGTAVANGLTVPITATREAVADEGDEDAPDDEAKPDEKDKEVPKEFDPERWSDAWTFDIAPVVQTANHDREPAPSPDGTMLSFRRSRGDIMILDLESGEERRLIEGWDSGIDWRWSPDSKRIAYGQNDRNFNADIWIVNTDGSGEAVNISQHPDNDTAPRWSADGRILAFVSERINEEYDVWSVYLDRDIEELTGKDLEDYYEKAIEKAKKIKPLEVEVPGEEKETDEEDADDEAEEQEDEEEQDDVEGAAEEELELDDAYLRLRRMTSMGGNEFNLELTPGGDRYIFTGRDAESGLFSIDWKGQDQKRLAGMVNVQHLTLTGDKVVFVSGGRAGAVGSGGGNADYYDISDTMRIDLQQQASQKFLEASRVLGEVFYHPTMKDVDWSALTEDYHALARQTRTADEFNYVAAYFQGELNGSHLGVRAPSRVEVQREAMGRIGIRYEVVDGGFRVLEIVPDSPADKGVMELKVGDVIRAINFESVEDGDTVERMLRGRIGQETTFDITREVEGAEALELRVILTPTSSGAINGLKYEAWQRRNQKLVHEWSDGRIGYLHIRGMNQSSLNEFERDLFAAANRKAGLLIDVRNNGGGSTADLVVASIMVQPHAYTVPRGSDPSFTEGYPQDRLFIQRYTKPVNMLCNEKSFSNAEIVSHAFKTLKRGNLVGQETYGGVISTGGTSLIDGTSVRTPFRGWYLLDGTDMENHGAAPDILVPQTPEDEAADFDRQLKAAVDDLLKRIDGGE